MRRIAVALVVVGLTAACIGFVLVRYPAVWAMVRPKAGAPSGQGFASPPVSAFSAASARPIAPLPVTPIPFLNSGDPVPLSRPEAGAPSRPPKKAAQQGSPVLAPAEKKDREVITRPLVPVVLISQAKPAGKGASVGMELSRLPPVDRSGPAVAERADSRHTGSSIPFYPSTGLD